MYVVVINSALFEANQLASIRIRIADGFE